MCGKSFLLIKPDGLDKKIVEEIIMNLQEKHIRIVKQELVYLTELDIMNIWPYTQSDIVSRQLLFSYLLNKKCVLYYLEAFVNDIYRITSEIKNIIRRKYGVHQYLSIAHSPSSQAEYKKDMQVFQKKIKSLVENKTIIGTFECYKQLEKENIIDLCQKISEYLNGDVNDFFNGFNKGRQVLYLHKNNINDSYFLAGILCDELGYSLDRSFYLAISVNYFTYFPIMKLEEGDCRTIEIQNIFRRYRYKTDITEGIEHKWKIYY